MAFDFWRFMSSPHGGVPSQGRASTGRTTAKTPEKPGVPWFVSLICVIAIVRVLIVTLLLLALSAGGDDPMPRWFDGLLLIYGAAMIAVAVFILNGFGWARLAWLVASLAIIAFLQDPIVIYVLVFDLLLLLVLVLPPSNRYMSACAAARGRKK